MFDFLGEIDEALFLFFHFLFRGPIADTVMWWISNRWIWIPMYVALLIWLIRRLGWKRAAIAVGCIALALTCADQVCANVIRPLVERMRPTHPDNPLSQLVVTVNDYRGGGYGFPSCHAANTFMLATFVLSVTRRRMIVIWMFVWALLNCLSRIYLGVHYPGDLLLGAVVGAFFGWIWALIGSKIAVKLGFEPLQITTDGHKLNLVACVGYLTLLVLGVCSLLAPLL